MENNKLDEIEEILDEEEEVKEKIKEKIENKEDNNKKKIGLIVAIIGIILLGLACYKLLIKKNPDNKQETDKNTPTATSTNDDKKDNEKITPTDDVNDDKDAKPLSIKKKVESPYFNIYLDNSLNVYLELRTTQDEEISDELIKMRNSSPTYVINNKNIKLFKIDIKDIKEIKYLNYGNGGSGFILLLNKNNKLYFLVDEDLIIGSDLTPITDNKLNKVSKTYSQCDDDGCMVYAEVTINGKKQQIDLYDLVESND